MAGPELFVITEFDCIEKADFKKKIYLEVLLNLRSINNANVEYFSYSWTLDTNVITSTNLSHFHASHDTHM